MSVTAEEFETDRGIRVGDDFELVKKVYGPNFYYRDEQSMTVLGYRDRKQGITLEFFSIDYLGKGIITSFTLSDYRHY
ncbi:hypothetical protein [Halalkalibacter krulwichiae]|uniref:DUF3601 domain-containing protein n=1 Tax=Halalkalibacter krulwichiae TaxID=199441 RepID=A0A1X9MGJ7_9BACI|nr:hypothetical protein [Halalkalibacter krulwichiae]ARK32546.1 hypothetical protein BkAM31D_23230 [Halalkalibacter krulwichiae]